MIFGALLALASMLAWAGPAGTEFVIVLDNSCSMVEETTDGAQQIQPAADPERRSVLGALLVAGLATDSDDRLTVLGFPTREGGKRFESSDPAAIRDIPVSTGTFFRVPLQRANKLLRSSDRDDRLLLFLSDGDPSDLTVPADGAALLGLDDATVPFDTMIVGLFAGDNPRGESFLRPLALTADDYVRVRDTGDLVEAFTHGYARVLGSKSISGRVREGQATRFDVGRYVTEVLVVTSSLVPAEPYEPTLRHGDTVVPIQARGDNGCSSGTRRNPDLCQPPRLHYATWRAPHDPRQTSSWELQVTGSDVAFGVILRYDLDAEAEVAPTAETNKPIPVRGRLTWNGEPFVDEEFFTSEDFQATAVVDGVTLPLKHVGQGVFEGTWTPRKVGRNDVVVQFSNTWMKKQDRVRVRVAPDRPLDLRSEVDALDFGHWAGERSSTERCVDLTVESSRNVGPDDVTYRFEGVPSGLALLVEPDGTRLHACARAKGCCGDLDASGAFLVVDARSDGETATVRIPVRAQVDRTGFLTCWWPWLLALLVLLFVLWFLYGWIRPHDFEENLTIKVAGSDRQLTRAASLVLREQPGGRRGFYRNARVALNAGGDFVRNPKQSAVWIEAVASGETRIHARAPVEVQDARTRRWVALTPEQAEDGIRPQTLYRVGDILFRFQ